MSETRYDTDYYARHIRAITIMLDALAGFSHQTRREILKYMIMRCDSDEEERKERSRNSLRVYYE